MQRKSEVPLALFNITYFQGNAYVKNITFLIAKIVYSTLDCSHNEKIVAPLDVSLETILNGLRHFKIKFNSNSCRARRSVGASHQEAMLTSRWSP